MKICSVSVGKDFCEKYSQKIKKYAPKNIELIVLTDRPEYFKFCKTELYEDKIFSYFSKNTFTSKISKKYKTDVLYIDADSFHIVDESIYKNQFETTYFLYDKLWPNFTHSEVNSLPKDLLDYYGINGNLKIENIHEKIFYLPYSQKINNLYKDLLVIKEIWDKETQTSEPKGNAKKYSKYGIGYGEGIPFSLSLIMNGIITKKYQFTKSTII
jgi:hypothetical protein